jgi:hypothetical protein
MAIAASDVEIEQTETPSLLAAHSRMLSSLVAVVLLGETTFRQLWRLLRRLATHFGATAGPVEI